MITVTYERGGAFLTRVAKLKPAEVTILCPVCGSALLVALSPEAAARLKIHPGFLCPKDDRHVAVTISFGR
jgi:hypothetical protein